jgi:hypothetical protein
MSEGHDVTQIGENWGQFVHRKLKIERCENGYIVRYSVSSKGDDTYSRIAEKIRVFLTNTDMIEFVERYFEGEPRP